MLCGPLNKWQRKTKTLLLSINIQWLMTGSFMYPYPGCFQVYSESDPGYHANHRENVSYSHSSHFSGVFSSPVCLKHHPPCHVQHHQLLLCMVGLTLAINPQPPVSSFLNNWINLISGMISSCERKTYPFKFLWQNLNTLRRSRYIQIKLMREVQ